MNITPNTILENGTIVCVGNLSGVIVGHTVEKDQFGMPITVHKIQYTIKYTGKNSKPKRIDKTERCNYSAINVVKELL